MSTDQTVDTWALGNNNVVTDIVVASQDFINSVKGQYQFAVDIANITPQPDIGWSYDGTNFAPPPYNGISQLQSDLDSIHNSLLVAINDAGGMTAQDVQTAISNATSDSSGSFTANESALFQSICNYVANGG